jgi:hypothetical protein
LIDTYPSVTVFSRDGVVYINTPGGPGIGEALADELQMRAGKVPGVKEVIIDISPAAAFFPD